ncbi:MAG: hypothetical protein K1X75_07880 [Leptospirales bacterium]|nr:hypothetical protein [Leptospirales bacterium]
MPNILRSSPGRGVALILVLLLACAPDPQQSTEAQPATDNRQWDDVARYLAGMPVSEHSALQALERLPEAARQREYFRKHYEPIEASRLNPMRSWAAAELADARSSDRTVFYPFGGPDFLHIYAFFPEAPLYIHFGLEPPGLPPDLANMPAANRARLMQLTRESLSSVLRFSFFRTNDMHVELLQSQIGVAPVLLAFAARNGLVIVNARNIHLDRDGQLQNGATAASSPGAIAGVEIELRNPNGKLSRLQYFSMNIANDGDNQAFFNYMHQQGRLNAYAKAASYLMHNDSFSKIRSLVLEQSEVFMQDDSGMPVRFFGREQWDVQLYGAYDRPIPLFANRIQNDLKQMYANRSAVKSLPFGIGYVFQQGRSNLMIARKRQ